MRCCGYKQMRADTSWLGFQAQTYFTYPFTLVSLPRRTFASAPLPQPNAYELYCPLSCKKIKIGAAKDKAKEAMEFNTTAPRWVSTHLDQTLRFLINDNPPLKKDRKKIEGNGWGAYVEVSEKGNFAVFNPYCTLFGKPLSLYAFDKLESFENPIDVEDRFVQVEHPQDSQEIAIGGKRFFLKQSKEGSFIGVNRYFQDDINGLITLFHPSNEKRVLIIDFKQAVKVANINKNYWLGELSRVIDFEEKNDPSIAILNLDTIFQQLQFALHLEEQIRAKLMNNAGVAKLAQHFPYHPRLYSAWSRLASFINYSNTKFSTIALAQAGFYNKSDMLQDLAFYEYPEVPIPVSEDPSYADEGELRKKLFPFSRAQRALPVSNVPLSVVTHSLLHQTVSEKPIIFKEIRGHYVLFVDEDYIVSVWSFSLFPVRLFSFNANSQCQRANTNILLSEAELLSSLPNVEKEEAGLASLFDEAPAVAKEVKPVEIVPDQAMIQQMQQMGYAIGMIKKALIAVKNQSVPAAIDMIDQLNAEEKKKSKVEQRFEWSCGTCTYINKAEIDTCEMCGQLCDLIAQADKERTRQEQEAVAQKQRQKEEERKKLQHEKEEERLRKQAQEAERLRLIREREEELKKSRLIAASLILHSTPIDPFFVVLVFRNEEKQHNIIKVVRLGLDRGFFSKFYRIEEKVVMGNLTRTPLPVEFTSFEHVAAQSINALEWGIRLIEHSAKDQWIISETKEFQADYSFTTILHHKGPNFSIQGGEKTVSFRIACKDQLAATSFEVKPTEHQLQPQDIEQPLVEKVKGQSQSFLANAGEEIRLDQKVTEVSIQILEHLPAGKWQKAPLGPKIQVEGHAEGEVTMSELVPLVIQHFQGSVFSGKHYSCSLLERSANLYISNYPQANFTFRHDSSRRMFAQRVVIVSSSKRLQRIFAVFEGLIFTANELTWFHLAKQRFANFTKADYEEWLSCKRARNNHRQFWEPVGFFQVENEAEIDLDYKRSAKYIFLLPTTIKNSAEKKKEEIYAIKIDFFGVKGRVEEERSQEPWYDNYKNEGKTQCEVNIFNSIQGREQPIPPANITSRRLSQVNSFNFLSKHTGTFEKAPVSATSIFIFRIRDAQHSKVIRVNSQYSKKVVVRVKRDISEEVDYTSITSFAELAKAQNEIALPQLKKLAERLDLKELLLLLLASDEDCSRYETLMNKIQDAPLFREKLFEKMLDLVPILVDQSIPIMDTGFKFFLTLYEKALLTQSQLSFRANTEALKRITLYVSERRNKNYNLLRSKYNIEELALEPYLFSKDYYRQIHPNYVEKEPTVLSSMEPAGAVNNCCWLQQLTPYAYRQTIDLLQTKRVENIRFFVPKIITTSFRPKLQLSLYAVDDSGNKLLYTRYFHEDLLVQLGVNGFKDNEIYRGARLNCLTVANLNVDARLLLVEVSFLLLTSQPHSKYKDTAEKFHLIPLVDCKEVPHNAVAPHVEKAIESLKSFPQEPRHLYMQERLPPAKYLTEGSKSIFHVYDFPRVEAALAKKEYRQIVDRITTNILDESIVREALSSLKISNYEFNHKGIDFAYTYAIHLMNFNRKYQIQLRISVDLALHIFETFVVFENGPIAKRAFSFLQETFKRFTNLEKATFCDALIDRYLATIGQLSSVKISDRYSPLKIIEKLQQFELPVGNLIAKLEKYSSKSLTLVLVKLIQAVTTNHGIHNLEKYCVQTGKYAGKLELLDLSQSSFKACLWVLDNIHGLREQALADSLDLLLLFLAGQTAPFSAEQRVASAKKFIEQLNEQQLWKLVFLTLKLKSETLKEKINRLFTVLTANLTEQFRKSTNQMVQQIIARQPGSIYVQINHELTQEQWMNHLQTTLQLISLTKDSVVLDEAAALKLLELPLTPSLWSRALGIIPRNDNILLAIIRNFPKEYYNSLGKEIAHFCEPLAGMKSLESIHVNWLDLIRQLRLEGRSLFELFVLQLQKSSFGGREGLSSATVQEVHQLEVSCDLLKLLLESKIPCQHFSQDNVKLLVQWYFLNKSKEKGLSPATDKLLYLSQSIRNLFQRMADDEQTVKRCIRCLLEVRRESEVIQRNFEQKRVPIHSALTLNKRFCECFEELLTVFMTTDALCSYFAFELKGLVHILHTMDVGNSREVISNLGCTPEEQFLLAEKIIATRANKEQPTEIKELEDLKEEEFANSVKLMPNLNPATLAATNADWSIHKKGSKTKLIFLPLTQAGTQNEFPLYLQLARTAQVRSIKAGFLAASYEFNDKLVATPSAVIVQGSLDGANFEPIGEMDYIQDDAYIVNGVQVWALNCQKTKAIGSVGEAVQSLGLHKVRYLKVIVRRPTVTFIQGQYSQLNGKNYGALGCNLSFLSVVGDDCEKHSLALADSCRQISKRSSLNLLATLLNEANPLTMRLIANDDTLERLFRENFKRIRDYMSRYPEVMPGVVYLIGAGNRRLGDWLVESFLSEGGGELEARIINQIITSTPDRAYPRIALFLRSVLRKLQAISRQSEIESGLLYAKEIYFLEAFCKTLEESYELGLSGGVLEVRRQNIDHIIAVYDRKHSSPQIKSLLKLLIHLLHVRPPLTLSEPLTVPVMELVWSSCTELRPHFYTLMAALLIDRKAGNWLRESGLQKIDHLIEAIYSSITHSQWKSLKLQLFLLGQISYHESHYLRSKHVQDELYNRLKNAIYQDAEITDAVLRIIRNIVLGNVAEQESMAQLLLQDVGLLVRKRDPFLQKLFVGVLGLESEVMIHVSGLDLQSSVKKEAINSKFLTKKHQKTLLDRIGKKCKYSLIGQINGTLSAENQDLFLKAFSCGSLLLVLRFKLHEESHTVAIHAPAPSKRNQEGDYFWQEVINYEKSGFICFLEQDPVFVANQAAESMLANIYGGDEEQDNAAVIYDDSQEVIQFTFSTSEASTPKLTLTKYKNQLPHELTSSTLDQDHEGYSFIGLEFWQLRGQSAVNVADSKLGSLLSKSNQARPPFSYYRHSPIYIFPANITLAKFVGLLGLRGSCTSKGRQLPAERILSELERESGDFIIDLQIQSQEESRLEGEEISEIGYIPVMTIFNHFSRLEGVSEVLRLGTQSLKDWRKADRKKNFEHYMDELRSFISLPNFFNLFIKNQQYVTLLFEVAAGLPDDENSTRNWEEEYVNNFRFIYKIVSDIFKYDRSPHLRNLDKYSDFLEVILEKLSEITKEAARVLKQEEVEEETSPNSLQLQKIKSEDRKRKKKGTGYGADNQNNSKWSASEWLEARKNVSQETLRVISIIASFLDCEQPLNDDRFTETIKQSCLLPLLESQLRSGSLLDISKEPELFRSYLHIVRLLASHPATIECLLDIEKTYKPEQSESVLNLLLKLNGIAEIFTQCLKSGKEQATSSNEVAEGISLDIQRTFAMVDKAMKNLKKKKKQITIKQLNSLPVAEAYRFLLNGLRFGYVSLKENGVFKHAHSSNISTSAPATSKVLRLSQELADLSSSLPCEHTNSIFVRCDRSRVDVINVLIMGSKDTPYSNGAFTFDVYCDDSYPNNPPKMLITTTGQGKIRFNPNLYSCGKVCLSLLGTWRGSASENWDPKVSTLLQLFISTQGITMSDDVYFNEPGFEGEQGTEEGERKNQAYSNIVRLGNVRYAMIGQIKNPPKGFEEVVKRHFYIKRHEIIEQCDKWVQYAEKREASYNGLVNDHNSSWCSELKQSKTKYRELLLKEVNELKELLSNLPPPDLKQEQEEQPTFQKEVTKEKTANKTEELKLEEVDVGYGEGQKEIKEYEENVMQDRWSRYIGAMGLQAVKKQAQSSVLLIGLKPLGLQIAKNLVLSGLKKLTILQSGDFKNHSQHFYMSNVKSNVLKDCVFKIKELNPYMLVEHVESLPQLKNYSVVISTEDYEKSLELAHLTRTAGVKFIYAESRGASGIYFADLGEHEVNDDNGEEPFEGMIKNISTEEEGLVTLLDGVKHPYQDGDYVVISKVVGMEGQLPGDKSEAQLFYEKQSKEKADGINHRVFKIKVVSWNSFRIGDTRNFNEYNRNGLCKNLKMPKKVQFKPLLDCSKDFEANLDPNMAIYDFEKMGDNSKIFHCFQALALFKKNQNSLPKNWNIKDSAKFNEILTALGQLTGKSEEEQQKLRQFGRLFAFTSEAELPTLGAYLGGMVAQEAIKAITNKYMPIRQFFVFHFHEMLQKCPEAQEEIEKKFVPEGEDFRSLKIVVGQEGADKVAQLKTFVIGAGAIGCELLKNFAMVNMGSKGEILVTDPDHIETSNLSRQFLFREKHVKKAKSATACATLLQLNPRLEGHIIARLDKVCEETEQIFNNQFFTSRGVVANALDNLKARVYMDKRCVENKVPLFESGTLGPKGHVQVIVPYKTENYGSQNDPSEEAQIPHCTLKMFPEETVHCIEWARDIFGKIFTLNPKALKKVIEAKDLTVLQGQEKETVARMIKYRPQCFDDCVAEAVRKFYVCYRNNVRQLLFTYPLDLKTKEGKLFWNLPKRPPKQISYIDEDNEDHRVFLASYAVLLAKIYGIPFPKDFRKPEGRKRILEQALKVKVEDFVPNEEASKELEKEVQKENQKGQEKPLQEEHALPKLQAKLSQTVQITPDLQDLTIAPQEFEKDEDSNGHIDLIYSMSNLRCQNYGIDGCTWIEAKLKAGKIMAALSTTTSVVAALQTIEIIKLATGSTTWRNGFINLAVPLVQISEPGPAPKHKLGNSEFTVWEDWSFKAATIKNLLDQLRAKYDVEGFNISTNLGKPVYWEAMYKDKEEAKEHLLNSTLKGLFGEEHIELHIAMRNPTTGQVYEHVPKIKVEVL